MVVTLTELVEYHRRLIEKGLLLKKEFEKAIKINKKEN